MFIYYIRFTAFYQVLSPFILDFSKKILYNVRSIEFKIKGGQNMYTCDSCNKISCKKGDMDNLPSNCPCREEDKIKEITKLYKEPQNYKIAHNSALVEAEGYCQLTRVQEIILFAKNVDIKRLDLHFVLDFLKKLKYLLIYYVIMTLKLNLLFVKMVLFLNQK